MSNINEREYYTRMAAGASDKAKLLAFLPKTGHVLDVGAGGGDLSALILDQCPGLAVTALDNDEASLARLRAMQKEYPGRFRVVNTRFPSEECRKELDGYRFDAVIFCSVLHEIFSYPGPTGETFSEDNVFAAVHLAADFLKPGGVLLIRDGVRSGRSSSVIVRYKDEAFRALAKRFETEFQGFPVEIIHASFGDVMPYDTMVELLYTCTWGEQSFPREVQEWYSFAPLDQWERWAKLWFFSCRLQLIHSEKYLQPGYTEALADKVIVLGRMRPDDGTGTTQKPKILKFPASNSIIVFQKV